MDNTTKTRSEKIKETKRLKEEAAKIQRAIDYIANQLADLRKQQLGEPTFMLKVGDEIQWGGIDKAVITEILDDGKIYNTHQYYTDNNYGNHIKYERDMYVAWHECHPLLTLAQANAIPRFTSGHRNRVDYNNTSLSSLISRYYSKTNMNPTYQRPLVWSHQDKESLIDSILNEIDIGKFTFVNYTFEQYSVNGGFQYEILDGKQRLSTIIEFIEGRFTYKGFFYRDMNPHDKARMESSCVLCATLSERTTEEEKLKHFLRVNTFGVRIDEEHLRSVRSMLDERRKHP